MKRYYFDTSIWLDFLENRNELNFPKGVYAKKLIEKIIKNNDVIIISDNNLYELNVLGYLKSDFDDLLHNIEFIESTNRQLNRAKDISMNRKIPKRDVLHALLAKHCGARLVSYDNHFNKTLDLIKVNKTKDLI
jgi:predicted nucleic acid-binding protein